MAKRLSEAEIKLLLSRLDGSGSVQEWAAIDTLDSFLGAELPARLLGQFRNSRKWRARTACVFYSIKYARVSSDAVALGKLAVVDKSKAVRYRGCMLLACSQLRELLVELDSVLQEVPENSRPDLLAAIDAITNQNQNYFADREHTGRVTLTVA